MSKSKHSQKNYFKLSIFALLPMLIIICLIEAGLRISGFTHDSSANSNALPFWVISNLNESNFVRDRLLFWRVPSNSPRLHTNRFGLRGPEFLKEKADDIYRIITLGDSCTWGFGVSPGQEYPKRLADKLNKSKIPLIFEVQNAGIPGYSSLQGLRYFKSELIDYSPDLITIYFGRNDRRKLQEEGGYAPDHEVPIPSRLSSLLQTVLNKAKTYQFLRKNLFLFLKPQNKNISVQRGQSHRKNRRYRVEADEFKSNISEILDLATVNSIDVIMITAPVYPPTIGHYNSTIHQLSNDHNIQILDAEIEFAKHDENGWLVDECHPNTYGHEWIAEELKKIIIHSIESSHFDQNN